MTENGARRNGFGCSCDQLDDDGDGVNECDDRCSDTLIGDPVDDLGCSIAGRTAAANPVPAPAGGPAPCGTLGVINRRSCWPAWG